MVPLRVSITKFEWLPDDPTDFVPSMLWKLPFITTWDDSRNRNHPTDSAKEASKHSAVIAAFGREFARAGVMSPEFHAHLRAASEARNISDYQLASHVTEEETAQHISHAEQLLAAAWEFLKAHPIDQADY